QYPSPYNTYLHPGLPPGPISNPGRTALESCVNPARSDYLYYFDDPSGKTHFATTLDRFNAEKSRYGVAGG
ncbi:MAG: endolytic transglycosylase MltG, partial [Candidatus Dormibacteraceae bacterium]